VGGWLGVGWLVGWPVGSWLVAGRLLVCSWLVGW
jgi:hypothetical protein